MLSTLLAGERHAHDRSVDAAHAYAPAERDPLTGLRNRRGLERVLEQEQGRIRRFGTNATVLMMCLDGPTSSPVGKAPMATRLLYLIMMRIFGWLVVLGRGEDTAVREIRCCVPRRDGANRCSRAPQTYGEGIASAHHDLRGEDQ